MTVSDVVQRFGSAHVLGVARRRLRLERRGEGPRGVGLAEFLGFGVEGRHRTRRPGLRRGVGRCAKRVSTKVNATRMAKECLVSEDFLRFLRQ